MGLQFKDLVIKREIAIKDLKGKILAVDSMNLLYQFLTTIRSADGSALTDSKGRVTSHLIGLFNRTTSLMEQGLKLVFVFDGKAPDIKKRTWEKRTKVKT
ncbi:MAG: flap structure-specific endonuclease, partial [Nanoarchaeota archaeon]|nr:flap structure-specific endonuclease [Nanoarchaeota archaeon]